MRGIPTHKVRGLLGAPGQVATRDAVRRFDTAEGRAVKVIPDDGLRRNGEYRQPATLKADEAAENNASEAPAYRPVHGGYPDASLSLTQQWVRLHKVN